MVNNVDIDMMFISTLTYWWWYLLFAWMILIIPSYLRNSMCFCRIVLRIWCLRSVWFPCTPSIFQVLPTHWQFFWLLQQFWYHQWRFEVVGFLEIDLVFFPNLLRFFELFQFLGWSVTWFHLEIVFFWVWGLRWDHQSNLQLASR